MKIKEGFILRTVCDESLVVPVGEASVDFKNVIKLNETGAFLWKLLEQDTNVDEMTDEETARTDILAFCDRLDEAGILE